MYPNDQILKMWVSNLQSKFKGDPMVNESVIVILLEQVWVKLVMAHIHVNTQT